jgi:hypothetical protein
VPIIDTTSGGVPSIAMGAPQYPPFTLMLGPDAPLADLENLWSSAVDGAVAPFVLTVRLQAGPSAVGPVDMVSFEMIASNVLGFSNGHATPAHIVIRPDRITLTPGKDTSAIYYPQVMLPVIPSPIFQLLDATRSLRLYQVSGGDPSASIANGILTFVRPDLSVTVVAPFLKNQYDVGSFKEILDWVGDVVSESGPPQRTVLLRPQSLQGTVLPAVEYPDCIPTRINLINPVLVNANAGVAPYVFDLRLRPSSVQ